jgi:ATP-dependent 26S proteasome regulatory subunit
LEAIRLRLHSGVGLLGIESPEEARVVRLLQEEITAGRLPFRALIVWSSVSGWRRWPEGDPLVPPDVRVPNSGYLMGAPNEEGHPLGMNPQAPGHVPLGAVLQALTRAAALTGKGDDLRDPLAPLQGSLIVCCDPPFKETDATQWRLVREAAVALEGSSTAAIFLGATVSIPAALHADVAVVAFPRPGLSELQRTVEDRLRLEVFGRASGEAVLPATVTKQLDAMAQACMGLTEREADLTVAQVYVGTSGELTHAVNMIHEHKAALVRQSEALELIRPNLTLDDIAGHDVLTRWMRDGRHYLDPAAALRGVEPPKGVAVIGVPGTGKSAMAKALANAWGLPLVQLKIGALFNKWVGGTEERTRQVFSILNALGRMVVWVDELEKAFGGDMHSGDGGTSGRVLQDFLTWLQDRPPGVVTYFTANDISALRPEMLRAGRVDATYFCDLPGREDRGAAIHIHRRRHWRGVALEGAIDVGALADASEGYTPAELEQMVKDANRLAFLDGDRAVTTEDCLHALGNIVPIVRTYGAAIHNLRGWVTEGRAIRASSAEVVPLSTSR